VRILGWIVAQVSGFAGFVGGGWVEERQLGVLSGHLVRRVLLLPSGYLGALPEVLPLCFFSPRGGVCVAVMYARPRDIPRHFGGNMREHYCILL